MEILTALMKQVKCTCHFPSAYSVITNICVTNHVKYTSLQTAISPWPCGLSHELSSLARTLGSWVRIALKAWMSVCVYSVFVLSNVSSGLATG
jgi:hypothetical protein